MFGGEDVLFILVLVYVVLLGGALLTARRTGQGGVRRLFAGALRWRIGWQNWAIVTVAIPAATIAVAATTGTYVSPPDGWLSTFGGYPILTFVFGALIINIFEEAAWQGLVQRNLARRHGVMKAALLTAAPFAAVHLPLSFVGDVTLTMHASFNASGQLDVVDGDWQYAGGLVIVAALLLLADRVRARSHDVDL